MTSPARAAARALAGLLAFALCFTLAGCAALADRAQVQARPGAAARGGYAGAAGYAASGSALADAQTLATRHGLVEVKAWTIQALDWRCMLYRLPPGAARDDVLQRLAADPRVTLAQPLNTFETLAPGTAGAAPPASLPVPARPPRYNDPYLPLQTGFATIDAGGAQTGSRGDGVTVAVIDTQVDAAHPDLQGRIAARRDFAGPAAAGETHGTAVAGVIAAVADNGIGIAGVAPAARLVALRSCWGGGAQAPARCNSFTLAQGLAAAMAEGADVINLSLAGPDDPLLAALARQAMARGTILVAALPASGRRQGFPSALPGVLVAATSEDGAAPPDVLAAPGRQVLSLAPGGGYDYASGSSMASAHLAGAAALLLARQRPLDAARLTQLLAGSAGQAIDACRALAQISPAAQAAACAARPPGPPRPGPSAAGWPVPAPARP